MNFWDSQYRRIWLPYVVRQCGKQENPKVCAILNRNYQPLSNVESISLATGTESGQEITWPFYSNHPNTPDYVLKHVVFSHGGASHG